MIIKADYLREHYTNAGTSTDGTAQECIAIAQGEVEQIIGQPVEARAVVWYFDGTGRTDVTCPYTLGVALTSVQYRPNVDEAWETVADCAYRRPVIECFEVFALGAQYRANLTVGLAAVAGTETKSSSFGSPRYTSLLGVICEMAAAKFYESASTSTDIKRAGLKSASESSNGIIGRTYTFRDDWDRWRAKLRAFTILRSF